MTAPPQPGPVIPTAFGSDDEDLTALASLAGEVVSGVCPPHVLRRGWDGPAEAQSSSQIWATLATAGLTSIVVPENWGGGGLGERGLGIVAEAAGRAALPLPLVESGVAALAIGELAARDPNSEAAKWLTAIAADALRATIAIEPHSAGSPHRALDAVPCADSVDLLVWIRPDSICLLRRDEYDVAPQASADLSRALGTVLPHPDSGNEFTAAGEVSTRVFDQAAAITAAALCGLSAHLLVTTTEYVKERRQFGQPIGSFQAVKHRLADAAVALNLAWPAVWDALGALESHAPDASTRVSVAKAVASDAAALVNEHALQCHGAIGFSWESDLHLWLKRGKALERAYGSAREHRHRISAGLFGSSR